MCVIEKTDGGAMIYAENITTSTEKKAVIR
jgi:hypothetical protein